MIDLKILVETDKAVIYATKEKVAVLAFRAEDSTIDDVTAKWASDELAALEFEIIGVVIISERKDFCAGAKLNWIESYQEEDNREILEAISSNYQSLIKRIQNFKKPVVTLIKEKTLDYGAELALCSPEVISINELVFGYQTKGFALTKTADEAVKRRLLPETVSIVERNVLLISGIQKVCQMHRRLNEMNEKMNQVIEEKVNPKLMEHQGWIELVEITDEREAVIRFRGACSGCMSNQETLDETILPILKEHVPEVKSVLISGDVTPELLDLAKSLLSK